MAICQDLIYELLFSVDCQWSDWSKTGSCSKSCGRGTQNFERTKLVESQNGGQLCTGSHTGSAHCNTHDCPSPGDKISKIDKIICFMPILMF